MFDNRTKSTQVAVVRRFFGKRPTKRMQHRDTVTRCGRCSWHVLSKQVPWLENPARETSDRRGQSHN